MTRLVRTWDRASSFALTQWAPSTHIVSDFRYRQMCRAIRELIEYLSLAAPTNGAQDTTGDRISCSRAADGDDYRVGGAERIPS